MSTDSTQHRSLAQRLYALRPNPTVLLFIATIAAILIANSPWNDAYNAFLSILRWAMWISSDMQDTR